MAVLGGGHEEEPRSRRGLDRGEPAAAGPDEEREDARMDRDLERLDARALRDRAQLALDLERVRRVGDDEAVARRRPGSGS